MERRKLSFSEYVLMENRNSLCLDLQIGEEIFGWLKTVGGLRKTRFRGIKRTQEYTCIVGAAHNLHRMSRLAPIGAVT